MPFRLNDLQTYAIEEFVENYHDGQMSRREMIQRVLAITGSAAATASVLLSLGCAPSASTPTPAASAQTPTQAQAPTTPARPTEQPTSAPSPTTAPSRAASASPAAQSPTPPPSRSKYSVKADDPAIKAEDVTFPGEGATLMGYLAQPTSGSGPFPGVLVCHEIFGLSEHIRDVTRRFAKAGYVALAVDLLSRDGGTAKVPSSQIAAKLTADPTQKVSDFQAGFRYLQSLPVVKKDAIGMVGFCYGGGITWRVVTAIPDLKAAVPFYGTPPPLEDVPKIKAAVLGIYGGNDTRVDATIPSIEDAMKKNGKTFEKIIYPGANHAFHNDTGPNWNEQAAYDAWQKTLDWLGKYLG